MELLIQNISHFAYNLLHDSHILLLYNTLFTILLATSLASTWYSPFSTRAFTSSTLFARFFSSFAIVRPSTLADCSLWASSERITSSRPKEGAFFLAFCACCSFILYGFVILFILEPFIFNVLTSFFHFKYYIDHIGKNI